MAQILTVCRIGTEWGFRDVTGEAYGHSTEIERAVESAHQMAGRVGGIRVEFTPEAEQHLDSLSAQRILDLEGRKPVNWRRSFRSLWACLRRPRDLR